MKSNYLSFSHSVTNNSEYYVIVGNCKELISQHKTLEEAEKAISKINVATSDWYKVEILDPGQTAELKNLEKTLYEPQSDDVFSNWK